MAEKFGLGLFAPGLYINYIYILYIINLNLLTMQKPIKINLNPKDTTQNHFYQICRALDAHDAEQGFSKLGQSPYMQRYHAYPARNVGLPIEAILTDAWNCNLITDQEYDTLSQALNPNRIYI